MEQPDYASSLGRERQRIVEDFSAEAHLVGLDVIHERAKCGRRLPK